MTEHHHDQRTPTPITVAAWFILGVAPTEDVPWWAAQWLADGHDSPALQELAGLNGRDSHTVNDLIPAALAELGIALPSATVAAAAEAFRELAEMCLCQLYGTEDAWQGDESIPIEDLKNRVRACCAAQLRVTQP